MSAIRPLWGDEVPHRSLTGAPVHSPTSDFGAQPFRARPVSVWAMHHDGSRDQAEAIAGWVTQSVAGSVAYVEPAALGNWSAVILQPAATDALWVTVDEYLVADARRIPRLQTLSAEAFAACYTPLVRELPIFNDGEVA